MWSVETLCDSEEESPCTANPWTLHTIISALRDPHVPPRAAFSLVVWPLAEAVMILTGKQSRAAWGKARKLRRGGPGPLHPHRFCLPHSGAPLQPAHTLPSPLATCPLRLSVPLALDAPIGPSPRLGALIRLGSR